jgi:hypothetical protein
LYSPTTTTRNYFDCLADTALTPSPPLPRANSITTDSVDSGEGVLLAPGNPECHCDVIHDVTMSHCQNHSITSS